MLLKNEKSRRELLNHQNSRGQTIFHWLVRMNKPDVLKYLIDKYGNYINWGLQDENRRTVLRYAQDIKRADMAKTIDKLVGRK